MGISETSISAEGLVVNSTLVGDAEDIVNHAKRVKSDTAEKLKQLRRKFEAQKVEMKAEINSIKVKGVIFEFSRWRLLKYDLTTAGVMLQTFINILET